MDKISVIVPVYNAEKFIDKCIESVINQTYKEIELILVNDGSKDNSLKILQKYEKQYPKMIKVFNQTNKGVGAARNLGIKHVSGKYIFFLDSDDWIELDYLVKLYEDISKNDIVISGFKSYDINGSLLFAENIKDNPWTKFKYCSIGGKLFLSSLILKNNILFREFKICEDAYFLFECYSKTSKISVSTSSGYCRLKNPTSVTHTLNTKKSNSILDVLKCIDTDIDCSNFDKKLLSYFYLKSIVLDVLLAIDDFPTDILVKRFEDNVKWYKQFLKKMDLKFKTIHLKYETLKINFVVNIFVIFYKLKILSVLIYLLKKGKVRVE
ncbi:MAG: glycosyltransferase family A protein [Bacilli bacterium]|nr:glycosyltransferase family A protein [Bacilli bacterium]